MYTRAIKSSSTAVSIGKKPGIGPRLSPLLLLNRGGRVGSLRLLISLIQALYTPILSPSIARPIWNYCSLQQLYISIYSAYSILLNFLIRSQSTAETGSGVAVVRACREESGISGKVGIGDKIGIGGKVGIEASSGKDIFGPSIVYSKGVGE